jgi:uncharacterized protein (DUF1499 family)
MKILLLIAQIIVGFGLIIGVLSLFMAILSRFIKRPANLGVKNGMLAACPKSPNCVSTQSRDARHRIDPLRRILPAAKAQTLIADIIRNMERARIITETPGYLYAEFRTKGMGYLDDVEFVFNANDDVIHFRSSSRLPYFDWGVNRRRMESIRQLFIETASRTK